MIKYVLMLIAACCTKHRPRYPFDAKNVPGDYVLRGDGWWCPPEDVNR